MTDEILQEVWKAKDGISAECGYDVKRLVRELRLKEAASTAHVIDLHAEKLTTAPVGKQTFNPGPTTGPTKGW
jgi:hypothetical protein